MNLRTNKCQSKSHTLYLQTDALVMVRLVIKLSFTEVRVVKPVAK